jgi:osmotically-inducible protein OsmY
VSRSQLRRPSDPPAGGETAGGDPIDGAEDDELRTTLRARLDGHGLVRTSARYEVAVSGGRATPVGHVRSRRLARGMAAAARRVRGVSVVEDRMVADDELAVRVASAISRGPLNRTRRLVVRAEFGRVRIGGVYPSPEARAEALRLGAAVPGVVAATAARATDLTTP